MFDLKFVKIMCVNFITMTSALALDFEMSDQGLDRTIRDYITFSGAKNIDENIVNALTEIVRDNSDIFNYIANSQTDPAFIPLLRKYSDLKQQFTGVPVNTNVRVLFSNNTTASKDINGKPDIIGAASCDFLTRTVFIDRDFWTYYDERAREAVLFHELGHCDLSRTHEDNNPDSFMNPLLLSGIFNPDSIHYQKSRDSLGISEEEINSARRNLDRTFQIMTEELFSKGNTCQYIDAYSGEVGNTCIRWSHRLDRNINFKIFRCHVTVWLKHLTIGPRQGRDWLELKGMGYNCFYNSKSLPY